MGRIKMMTGKTATLFLLLKQMKISLKRMVNLRFINPKRTAVVAILRPRGIWLFLLLMAPLLQTSAQVQSDMPAAISSENPKLLDGEIETRLVEIFLQIDGLENIGVDVRSGVVSLTGEVPSVDLIGEAERLSQAVEGVIAVQNEIRRDSRVNRQVQMIGTKLFSIGESAIVNLPVFLLAILIVFGFWYVGGLFSRAVSLPKNWTQNVFVRELAGLVLRVIFSLAGVLLAAELVGATAFLVSIMGGIGVLGLALGFAIRDTVENFVASVLLSIRQPFGTNEHVLINANEGRVSRLTSRATILLDMDGNHVRIPNSVVYKSTIVNFTRNPKRRFHFDVGVDTEIAPQSAQSLAMKALGKSSGVLADPPPLCIVYELGDSNVVLRIYGWVDQTQADFSKTRSSAMSAVKKAYEEADITMPEPIYRLRIDSADSGGGVPRQSATLTEIDHEESLGTEPDTAVSEQVIEDSSDDDLLTADAARE